MKRKLLLTRTVSVLALIAVSGCAGTDPVPCALVGPQFTNVEPSGFAKIRGGRWHLPAPGEARGTALIFVSRECPISNGYSPEINRMVAEYGSRGISFCLVYTEADLDAATAARHAADYGYTCPAVLDPDLTLAARAGVTITPEAAVLSADGGVVYRGRIDDRYPSLGKQRPAPTRTELRDALDAVLAGRPVAVASAPAVGCFIERRPTKMEAGRTAKPGS